MGRWLEVWLHLFCFFPDMLCGVWCFSALRGRWLGSVMIPRSAGISLEFDLSFSEIYLVQILELMSVVDWFWRDVSYIYLRYRLFKADMQSCRLCYFVEGGVGAAIA